MSRHHQLHLRSSSSSSSPSASFSLNRRHSLLLRHASSSFSSSLSSSATITKPPSFGEVAGGTTAECAAICCCCPCGLVNFFILTIYKVPARLCRAALRRKRRKKLLKKGLLPSKTSIRCKCGFEDYGCGYAYNCESSFSLGKKEKLLFGEDNRQVEAMVQLEKKMWDTFYGTGFWRSPSQKEHFPPLPHPLPPPLPPCSALSEAKLL